MPADVGSDDTFSAQSGIGTPENGFGGVEIAALLKQDPELEAPTRQGIRYGQSGGGEVKGSGEDLDRG